MPADIETWLKNTIVGIVLLGALGSLLAVLLARILLALRDGFLRAPYDAHRKRQIRQAYFLGGAAANIEHDKTGRMLTAYLAFHLCRFAFALALLLFAAVLAGNVLVFQERVVLSVGLFVSVVTAFLSLYWAYFEFEYIHRTYLFFWKNHLKSSEASYQKYLEEEERGPTDVGSKEAK